MNDPDEGNRVLFADLPIDILSPILEQLSDARDWYSCTLVNKTFNKAATPLLYRTLDSKIVRKDLVHHPASTILQRPELAQYVRRVTESGSVHRRVMDGVGKVTQDALEVLELCTSLRSFTWTNDTMTRSFTLIPFLDAIKKLPRPLEELKIRVHNDPDQQVWDELHKISGLRKVSIWCMEGPPRVLRGWSERLGPTLTHLELGRCAGVPPTILIAVLMDLPKLEHLCLKGAPASAITSILAVLPNLKFLDTEYLPSVRSRGPPQSAKQPKLQSLIVRTSSADYLGPGKLWTWIHELLPGPEASLQSFSLHAFILSVMGKGRVAVPRGVMLELGRVHGTTLRQVLLGDAQLTLADIECMCEMCPQLEVLACCTVVEISKLDSVKKAIACAKNLRTLTLYIVWIPTLKFTESKSPFTLEVARDWMLRSEDSCLRYIAVNDLYFMGKWVLREKNEDSSLQVKTTNITKTTKSKRKEKDPEESRKPRLEFVVTIGQPKDRWYMRFGSEFGLTKAST